jgi:hypothetical protein
MYTVCTLRLSQALDVAMLARVAGVFVYVALTAWVVVAGAWIAARRAI